MNLHTVQFGGGEIRGAIQLVPEPATATGMLLAIGAIAIIGFARLQSGPGRRQS